ncbi:MAG TPA: transglycosylase domain-containing protein [Terriglobales bacterium]|nr:transglycosylase domain-containing protein [Terriglobales bacterium]
MPKAHTKTPLRTGFLRSFIRWVVIGVVLVWSLAALILLAVRWIDPPSTAVHIQRRLQAWVHHTPYHERYKFLPLSQISPDLQHAVMAAEDARFYQHHGFDWHEIQIAAEDDLEGGRTRGASTITQQLVKNLFFGTGRSVLRKGAEFTLVPVAEFVLGKRAFWRSTSTWLNGALVFMVQSRRAATTTESPLGISAGSRRHGSPRFCRRP